MTEKPVLVAPDWNIPPADSRATVLQLLAVVARSRCRNISPEPSSAAVLISFISNHFYLYIIFVLKINIVFLFVSVNDGQNIFVSVIVTVLLKYHCNWHVTYTCLCLPTDAVRRVRQNTYLAALPLWAVLRNGVVRPFVCQSVRPVWARKFRRSGFKNFKFGVGLNSRIRKWQ